MKRWLMMCLMLAISASAAAEPAFKPFLRDSRPAIERNHAGQPFVVAFWSVDCAYCMEEIRHLDALAAAHPGLRLVLVGTDGMALAGRAAGYLEQLGLDAGRAERWQFAEPDHERLYFAVDRQWRGTLPRTYFYDAAGRVVARSGRVDPAWMQQWAKAVTTP